MLATGTADLICLKLHSSTSIIEVFKITKGKIVYIGQPENMSSLLVFIDKWEIGYPITFLGRISGYFYVILFPFYNLCLDS